MRFDVQQHQLNHIQFWFAVRESTPCLHLPYESEHHVAQYPFYIGCTISFYVVTGLSLGWRGRSGPHSCHAFMCTHLALRVPSSWRRNPLRHCCPSACVAPPSTFTWPSTRALDSVFIFLPLYNSACCTALRHGVSLHVLMVSLFAFFTCLHVCSTAVRKLQHQARRASAQSTCVCGVCGTENEVHEDMARLPHTVYVCMCRLTSLAPCNAGDDAYNCPPPHQCRRCVSSPFGAQLQRLRTVLHPHLAVTYTPLRHRATKTIQR